MHHKFRADLKRWRQPWLLLVLWFLVLVSINAWWHSRNQRRMAVQDSYTYLLRVMAFDKSLDTGHVAPLSQLSLRGRPPLYQLLAIPFLRVCGRSEHAALLVNIPFLGLLIGFTYALGARWGDRRTGLLAVFLVTTVAPALHLSRCFTPYYAMFCWSPLSCWAILNLCGKRSPGSMWLMFGVLSSGLLIHPSYAYLFVVPGIFATVYVTLFRSQPGSPATGLAAENGLWSRINSPLVIRGLLPGAIVCAVPVLGWYLTAGMPILDLFAWLQSPEHLDLAGSSVIMFGGEDVSLPWLWYPITFPRIVSLPLAVIGVCGILHAARHRRFETSLLLGIALVAFLVLGSRSTLAWARGASLLAIFAVLSANWIFFMNRGTLRAAILTVCIATGLFNYAHVTWGFEGRLQALAQMIGSQDGRERVSRTLALGASPPRARQIPLDAVIDCIREDLEGKGRSEGRLLLTAGWSAPFVRFHLENQVPDLKLSAYRQARFIPRYRISFLLDCDYILCKLAPVHDQREHAYNKATREFFNGPPASFLDSHAILQIPGYPHLRLWVRTCPVSVREATECYRAVALADKYKRDNEYFALLAGAYLAEGDLRMARATVRQIPDRADVTPKYQAALDEIIND